MKLRREREQLSVQHARCPYCHDVVPKGERPEVCAECHALHHAACYEAHGACSACGQDLLPGARALPRRQSGPPVCTARGCNRSRVSGRLCESHASVVQAWSTAVGLAILVVVVIAIVGVLSGSI